jgi:secreted PhoX family phosphatase
VAGEPVGGTDYLWHIFPDGAATFEDGDGGWYHTVNSEVFIAGAGGVSGIHYDVDGNIIDAYPILTGSIANCAGGPTPWGTWLSCEEDFVTGRGMVWECDPTGETDSVARPAMGLWAHEAAAVDPVGEQVYLTEDNPEGLLYRFTPTAYPDLSAGVVEAATVAADGTVTWTALPDASAAETPTREQLPAATRFNGGEGCWYHDGVVYFTTKGDHSVHAVELSSQSYSLVYRAVPEEVEAGTAPLWGVDNMTVDAGTGDLFVAEDGGLMRIVIVTPEGTVAPFLHVVGQEQSEITGPTFNPRRDRLYFSSQRGPSSKTLPEINPAIEEGEAFGGVTYEIAGPFRGIEAEPVETTTTTSTTEAPAPTEPPVTEPPATEPPTTEPATTIQSPTTTLAQVATTDGGDGNGDGGGNGALLGVGIGVAAVAAAGGALLYFRNRGAADGGDPGGTGSSDGAG